MNFNEKSFENSDNALQGIWADPLEHDLQRLYLIPIPENF